MPTTRSRKAAAAKAEAAAKEAKRKADEKAKQAAKEAKAAKDAAASKAANAGKTGGGDRGGTKGQGKCVLAGTLVFTLYKQKVVEDVVVGDKVYSYNFETQEYGFYNVNSVMEPSERNRWVLLTLSLIHI